MSSFVIIIAFPIIIVMMHIAVTSQLAAPRSSGACSHGQRSKPEAHAGFCLLIVL